MKIPTSLLLVLGILLSLLVACEQPASTSLEWPEVTSEAKPWSRWWWHGSSITKEGVTAELEAFQKGGLGGLEITPIYGVIGEEDQFIDYLSPEWMDILVHTLREAERLGLGIDLATGTGWPFGGPWVDETDACKYVTHKSYTLKEGERLQEPVSYLQEPFVRAVTNQVYQLYGIYKEKGETLTGSISEPELLTDRKALTISDLVEPVENNKNLQALALDQVRFEKPLPLQVLMAYSDEGKIVNLTEEVAENGQLNWTAPEGNWTLYALFQGWHGKMVERAAPGGEGNVIDHFSTTPIKNYLARFDRVFADQDLRALRGFFNDSYEVDDARGQSNWTPDLFGEFEKRRGYDLRQHLPALLGQDTEDMNHRVLADYRETFSDLILETFTSEWGTWARSKGAIIRNQAHGSPANILDLYGASDIPETEGTDLIRIKFASSAAHVTGEKLVSAESATWLNEHFVSTLADLKENMDRYLVGGVNHVLYHGTCYSPPGGEWPGRLFYAAVHANPRNSLWHDFPALNEYIARSQSFLQSGNPDNDVLLYFPIYDRFSTPGTELLEHFTGGGPGMEGTPVKVIADRLQTQGYAFDFISDRQVLELQANNTQLETNGNVYQTIVVPECQFMPLPTFEKLLALAQNGAQVIFHRTLPVSVPGLGNLDGRLQKMKTLQNQFQFEELSQGIAIANVGKGALILGENLEPLLAYTETPPETLVAAGLEYTRRHNEHGTYYFITNWSGDKVEGWIPLQAAAKAVALFDPMTGKNGLAKIRHSELGTLEVYLQLPRGASCILQTLRSVPGGESWPYFQGVTEPIALEGAWNIDFLEGGPELPASVASIALGDWTELEGAAYQRFSGTARYTFSFPKPEESYPAWLLDLGEVRESATVILNGQLLGTLIGPVFQVIIEESLLQENNTLEVEVSNLMANRIADLDRRGVFWKKFYNINFPPRRRENRGTNGLFDASKWAPLPSGLMGPVTLSGERTMAF